ncbi:MAG TPA: hypothetical protein EYQ87_02985 [Candidatus Nitrosopelagicus sp.]|jgi:hypothetical protein|nr:hypothetical protein [Candidatus Nitrosopelagicus sp.]
MGYGNSQGHDDSQDGTHAMIDKLEHELGALEFNRPYDVVKIRKLKTHLNELKVKLVESELAFGQH